MNYVLTLRHDLLHVRTAPGTIIEKAPISDDTSVIAHLIKLDENEFGAHQKPTLP